MTINKVPQCQHCLRDDDECESLPCSEVIEKRGALAHPYYDANGEWQSLIVQT